MTRSSAIKRSSPEPIPTTQWAGPPTEGKLPPQLRATYSWATAVGLLLFLSVACVFYVSPVHYVCDSAFSLLMDEALIHKWTPNMIQYQVPRGHGGNFKPTDGYPYPVGIIKGRLLYLYPWGSSLLCLPAVAVFNAVRFRVAPHHKYDADHETRMQAIIATGLCALSIWIVYQAAGYLLPLRWSLAIAVAAAFGTPIWSTASRSLWSQTWGLLLITVVIWVLLSGSIRPFVLATALAWSCLVRPQVIPQALAVSVYVLLSYERSFFWRYVATGLCWAIPVCAMTWFFTGGIFSALYSPDLLDFPHQFWGRLYGVLLSPSRGFIIFSPIIFVPSYLTFRYWKVLPERRLAILALVVIGMHLAVLASFARWWAGESYGPRYLLEVVPWFAVLAILGVRSFLDDNSSGVGVRWATTSIAALTLVASIAINAPGALVQNSIGWRPIDPEHPDVIWDWHDPQFLSWLQ